jgi:hypothetical protein
MGFLPCGHHDDPVVATLRDVFTANVLRVPEERMKPLTVIASHKGERWSFRGAMAPLLENRKLTQSLGRLVPSTSQMPNLTNKKTRHVEFDLGLSILDGFLSGFGIPSAGLDASFENVGEIAFSFDNVERHWLDVNVVGASLTNEALKQNNPAGKIFFDDDPWSLNLVDSIITSSDFTITAKSARKGSAKIDVPTIQNLVAKAKAGVQVKSTSASTLTFAGSKGLTFAFSCVRLYLDPQRRIRILDPRADLGNLATDVAGTETLRPTPNYILTELGLISFDDDSEDGGTPRRASTM